MRSEANSIIIKHIRIKNIHVGKRKREYSAVKVSELGRSIQIHGMLNAIIVRPRIEGGYILVAGHHRLKAALKLGWKRAPCQIQQIKNADAEKIEVTENFHRADLTVIEWAEHYCEWAASFKSDVEPDLKRGPGRPTSKNSLLAMALPSFRGKEAIRKELERATKIADMPESVKKAAIRAGFERNQSKLLKIAAVEGDEAQLEMVRMLSQDKRLSAPETSEGGKGDVPAVNRKENDRTKGNGNAGKAKAGTGLPDLNQLQRAWEKSELQKLWKNAVHPMRLAFVKKILGITTLSASDSDDY